MDTNLAVAGMGRSFSGNPAIDNAPTMDIPTDQDTRRWPSLSQSSDEFTTDVYQMSTRFSGAMLDSSITRPQGSQGPQEQPYIYQPASDKTSRRESQVFLTNAATHVVSEKLTSDKQQPELRRSLSNAPQTKFEQQRSALQKLSRAIDGELKSSSSSQPVDLEDLVLRILHKATDSSKWSGKSSHQKSDSEESQEDSTAVMLTKGEALKASQMISNLFKQSPGSAYIGQRRSTQGSISNAKVCPICNYSVARECDLRKHMKRHQKPYGCTYPECHKRFGAKSDWKRHENSQHFQLEAFRCAQPSQPSQGACGAHFTRPTLFDEHLKTKHSMPSQEQRCKETKRCRIGKNCQGQFWCGFCNKVIELKERRNAAWDERFDHIAYHFEKEMKNIDEWVCVEKNQTKRELSEKTNRYVFEDDDEMEGNTAGDVNEDNPMPPPPVAVPETSPVSRNPGPPPPSESYTQVDSKKRHRTAEPLASHKRVKQSPKTPANRFCVSGLPRN